METNNKETDGFNYNGNFEYGLGLHPDGHSILTSMHFGSGNITLGLIEARDHPAKGILFRENNGTVSVGDTTTGAEIEGCDDAPRVVMLFDNHKSVDVLLRMLSAVKLQLIDNLGDRLIALRKNACMTVYKAASTTGLTQARLNSLEIKRSTDITLDEAFQLGHAYGVSMLAILESVTNLSDLSAQLKVSPKCDSKYPITWALTNVSNCYLSPFYNDLEKEQGAPSAATRTLLVAVPDSESYAEYTLTNEGWVHIGDRDSTAIDTLAKVSTLCGITAIEQRQRCRKHCADKK